MAPKNNGQLNRIFSLLEILIIIKDNFQYNWEIGIYFQIILTLYPLSILLLQIIESQFTLFRVASLILIRPDILLLQTIGLWTQYGYIISMGIYFIQKITFLIFLYTQNGHMESNLNKFNKWIYFYLAIYQTLFFQVLLIPLTLICMQSYNSGFIQQDIVSIFFSIFMFILLQLDAIFFLYLNESALTYRLRALDKTKITFYDVISYTLKIAQIALFGVYQDNAVYPYILTILIFFISIIEMANQYINQSYIHRSNRLVLYAMNLLAATISFFYFIDLQSQNSNLTFSFTLLLYPLILQLILHIDKEYQILCFFSQFSHKEHNLPHLFHQLIKVVNYCDTQDIQQSLKTAIIISKHKQKCKEMICACCLCQSFSDTTSTNLEMEKLFFQQKFNMISKIIFNSKTPPSTLYKFCILLYSFNYLIQATKYFYLTLGMSDNLHEDSRILQINSQQRRSSHSLSESFHQTKQTQIKSHQQLPLIIEIKIKYLIAEAKKKMNLQLSNETNSQFEFSEQIQRFYLHEGQLAVTLNQIRDVLLDKIAFYVEYTKRTELNFDLFLKQVISINYSLSRLTTKLKTRYASFPSKKLQQVICYLESEINNDYAEGFKYQNLSAISEEKLLKLNSNKFFNFYSDDISYLIFEVEEDLQNLKIQRTSSNFQAIGEQPTLSAILPNFIVHEHPILVGNFLKKGVSKFYRQFRQSFIKNKDGFTKSMLFCFDNVQSIESDKMTFIAFIRQVQEYSAYIMLDINKQIGSITKIFIEKCGYDEDFINQSGISEAWFESLPIMQFIPQFEELLLNSGQVIKKNNASFSFFDLYNFSEEFNNQLNGEWINLKSIRDTCKFTPYIADIIIIRQEVYGFYYYILEFLSISKIDTFATDTYRFQERSNSHEFDISDINISQEESKIKITEAFQNKMVDKQNFNNQIEEHVQTQQVGLRTQRYNELEIQLQSPNQSNMIEHSFKQQQQYYCQPLNDFNQEINQQKLSKNSENSAVINQHQEYEGNSHQSSLLGAKKLKFIQKYELYQQVTRNTEAKPIQLCTIFLLVQLILYYIYCGITLTVLQSDIQNFIKEIDMIALHASIIGPHDLFFSSRVCITSYQQLQREGYINSSTLSTLISPLYQYIGLGYEELRLNFFNILSNQYLQDFFTDVSGPVLFMRYNDKENYPMNLSFKEELLVTLQYQYQYKRTFDNRWSTAGKPFQVFQFSNYFKLHVKLEKLTLEIKQYSKDRSDTVLAKWNTIWILFQLINIFISLIILYYLNLNLAIYDKFLRLFLYLDKSSLTSELERLKQLLKEIDLVQESIYEYKFDQDQKERSTIKSNQLVALPKLFKISSQTTQKLSRISIILQVLIFYGIFCIYSTILDQETKQYLTRYKSTTDFYKLIQDLRFRSGNIYLYREIRMRWQNFTYLTDEDYNILYSLMDDSQSVMNQYLTQYLEPDLSQYLCSDQFINFFYSVQRQDLCNFLDQTYTSFMYRYCDEGLQGTIRQGMITCLNFILNSIKTQQAVNNFTKREEVYFYELEGAQLVTRVFVNMSYELKTGIVQITEEKNQFDQIFTAMFLTYNSILGFLVLIYLRNHLKNQFYYVRKIINLMPINTLLNDNSLERMLRQYLLAEQF